MHHDRLRAVSVSVVDVTPQTRWIFVEVETEEGLRGVGEATLPGQEDAVAAAVTALAPVVLASRTSDPEVLVLSPATDLPQAAARSAIDQALWDVFAQRRCFSIAEALGRVQRTRVPVYANINRRTIDRSPAGFAVGAQAAIAAGHNAIKIAPFDEVVGGNDTTAALAPGLARLAAVRDVVGGGRLMVDCHWRLKPASAEYVIDVTADMGVTWIECPLPETRRNIPAITRLRKRANRLGIILAGMETAIGLGGFLPFIEARAYDVMMPDIKYVGSLRDVIRLSKRMDNAGIGFSPHNPSGPVCHAISLQICATVARVHSLETQFDETPVFSTLAGAAPDGVIDGGLSIPAGLGAGIALQRDVLAERRSMHWATEGAIA